MIIRRETLQAALAATTPDDTRYYLNCVQADPAQNRVVATNGHILIIATDRWPMADADFPAVAGAEFHGSPEGPVCLDADVCRSMIATMPKKHSIDILKAAQLSVNGSPTTLTFAATDLKAPRVATIDTKDAGQFPAIDRIMPKADRPELALCLAVDVLESLLKATKAIGARTITFGIPTEKTEVLTSVGVTMKGADVTVTGLAMPCKI